MIKHAIENDDQLLTIGVSEAAQMLGISRNTAYTYVATGKIPSLRFGRTYRVPLAALENMLASSTVPQSLAIDPGELPRNKLRRFTPEEDKILIDDYLAYVPTGEIAARLERDIGTVRQRVLSLGLRRSALISKLLPYAPEHLREHVASMDHDEWIAACQVWQDEQKEHEGDAKEDQAKQRLAQADEILAATDIERNHKMIIMRTIGLTLEEISLRFGVTRERVRQITSPDYTPPTAPRSRAHAVVEKMGRWNDKIERERSALIQHALGELRAIWEAAPEEARQQFFAKINVQQKAE